MISALKYTKRHIATFIKVKKALVYKWAFLKLYTNLTNILVLFSEIAYIKITKKLVSWGLITEVAIKTFRPDKISLGIFQII